MGENRSSSWLDHEFHHKSAINFPLLCVISVVSLLCTGVVEGVVQTGSTFVLVLQRHAWQSLRRGVQLPVSVIVGSVSPVRVATLATLARRETPLPQVVHGLLVAAARSSVGVEGTRGDQRRDDDRRQRGGGDSATTQPVETSHLSGDAIPISNSFARCHHWIIHSTGGPPNGSQRNYDTSYSL